ncbi:hypothetical protein SAMN05216417_1137 [Nitrosospira multiformis]|uniref:Uncharacterized protein n=1 Tax=Nitrosospira multiformis TaxID=1231 RepID=A0A1I7HZ70_9PROT|nr:hypothetical protein SAMN05216417_1137 [Nitrosospira multiformis]
MGDEQQTCAQYYDVTPEKENTLAQLPLILQENRVIMRLRLKSAILIHGYRYIPFL